MRVSRALGACAGGTAVVGLLVGCSGGEPATPVPTVAVAPFICDGVPLEGVQILVGEDLSVRVHGVWGADGGGFGCIVDPADGHGPSLMILERGRAGSIGGEADDASELERLMEQAEAAPIVADFPGSGVLFGPDKPTAVWVCDGRELSVEVFADDWEEHDRRPDAERLLISMLPWACDGQPVPTADPSLRS